MSIYNNILKAIEEEIEKCSKPKIIQDLPHDLRSQNIDEMKERFNALVERINELEDEKWEIEEKHGDELNVFSTDVDFISYWEEDRDKWKEDIKKFEEEDKVRLDRKMQLIDEIQKEWDELKENYDISSLSTLGGEVDSDIRFLKDTFKETKKNGGKVPAISVLQDEEIPYSALVKDDGVGGKYDSYFDGEYNTFGKDNKWSFNESLKDIKRLNKDGSLDGIISKMEEIKESPRTVQNDAKKYVIMKENYNSLNRKYKKETNKDSMKLNPTQQKYKKIQQDLNSLYDEADAMAAHLNKMES